uniref:Uncharacterized protein n=1 Tax=Anguilla anguilla TaxID=7936 RepID=A0A0E9PZQ3_ANGAN
MSCQEQIFLWTHETVKSFSTVLNPKLSLNLKNVTLLQL